MSTAFNRPALWKRVGALALAGTIALGTIGSGVGLVSADSGDETTPTAVVTPFTVEAGSVDSLEGITAVVVGGGTSLVADPGKDGTVLAKLADGTIVTLRIDTVDSVLDADGVTRWWPVTVDGQDGWVSGNHLANPDSVTPVATTPAATSTATAVASATPFEFIGEAVPGIQVQVAGDGEAVNMRAEGSADSSVVAEVPDGSIVTLRIDTTDTVTDGNGMRWWPVSFDGKDGWISGQYLRSTTPTPTATAGETEFVPGAYVRVKTESGEGAILREQPVPSAASVTVWADGQVAQIIGGPLSFENSERGWFKVSNGANTGYIDGDLLELAGPATSPSATSSVTAVPGSVFAPGDTAMVQTERKEGANLRESGDPAAASKGVVTEGATVTIVSGPASFTDSTNGWFEVSWNGQTGFVDGDLLVKLASGEAAPTATAPVATATATASSGTAGELGQLRKGDSVSIAAGGDGVNVRQSPADGSTIAGFLSENASATIIDGPVRDDASAFWYKVSSGGDIQGWVPGRFLNTGSTPVTTTTTTPVPSSTVAATTPGPTVATTATSTVAPSATSTSSAPAVSAQGFIFPLDSYTVTQGFGCSYLGFYAYDATLGCPVHDGLDLAAPAGTPIHAAKAGTVVAAGWCDCGLGYYVEIDHGNGVHTLYGHMQTQPWVSVGQTVAQGDEIGPVGSTGLSTGPHTHFMVTVDGVSQDPTAFLP